MTTAFVKYGEFIDDDSKKKEEIYKLLVDYFDNPLLKKYKNDTKYSIYMIKINVLLSIEYRYLIVYAPLDHYPIGYGRYLSDIKWINLQTRTLTDNYKDMTKHTYRPSRLMGLNKQIHLLNRDVEKDIYYSTDFPDILVVLFNVKKNDVNYNNGNLINAIETYQTLITFK